MVAPKDETVFHILLLSNLVLWYADKLLNITLNRKKTGQKKLCSRPSKNYLLAHFSASGSTSNT